MTLIIYFYREDLSADNGRNNNTIANVDIGAKLLVWLVIMVTFYLFLWIVVLH